MYKKNKHEATSLKINNSKEGETIEAKVRRIMNNKEPITDGAPIIYTERKDGVRPEMDIRTDRFNIALDATDYISKSNIAKREMSIGERTFDTLTPEQQAEHIKKFPQSKHNNQNKLPGNEGKSGA